MSSLVPPADLVARFAGDLERLVGPTPERLGVAVSGGADSLALLLLAAAALPGRVEAATVDHGLRVESAAEAHFVAEVAGRLRCPHAILKVTIADGPAGLQAEAREARYGALRAWCAERGLSALATAHHADDQAETVLMRLRRGSGVAGLGGIRPVRSEGELLILRPLLGWSKVELIRLVAEAGLEAIDDPSNRNPRFDRVVVRGYLEDSTLFDPHRLARTAAACREADAALDWMARQLAKERLSTEGGEWRIDISGLPRELRRRLLVHTIKEARREHGLGGRWREGEDVEGLLSALERGGTATRAGLIGIGGPLWRLRPAPPRR